MINFFYNIQTEEKRTKGTRNPITATRYSNRFVWVDL